MRNDATNDTTNNDWFSYAQRPIRLGDENKYDAYVFCRILGVRNVPRFFSRYIEPEHIIHENIVTEEGLYDLLYAPPIKHETRVAAEKWLTNLIEGNRPKKIADDVSIHSYYSETFGYLTMFEIDKQPWFVGKEIAEALGYSNTRNAILAHVWDSEKVTRMVDRFGYNRKMVLITERGMCQLVMASRMPKAESYRYWIHQCVTGEARSDSSYSTRQARTIQKIMTEYEKVRAELEELKKEFKKVK